MDTLATNKNKGIIVLLICFIFLIGLYIPSTVWFRLRLSSYYVSRCDYTMAIVNYKKILRKAKLDSSLSEELRNNIGQKLNFAYFKRVDSFLEKEKYLLSSKDISERLEVCSVIAQISKDYEDTYDFYCLPKSNDLVWKEIRAKAYFELAGDFFVKNKLVESKEQLRQIYAFYPSYKNVGYSFSLPEDHKRFGLFLANIGLNISAIEQFKEVCRLAPNDLLGYYRLALTYQKIGMNNEALGQFQRIIDLYNKELRSLPDSTPSFLGNVYYMLALNSERQGNLKQASEEYKEAVKLNTNKIDAYYRLSLIYQKLDDKYNANRIIQGLVDLKPEYQADYKFNKDFILLGCSFDKVEFEINSKPIITFYWEVQARNYSKVKDENIEIVYDSPVRKLYRTGNHGFEVKMVSNLAPDFGFEIDSTGIGFPYGWDVAVYTAFDESYKIAFDEGQFLFKNQVFVLDNTLSKRTGRASSLISIDPQSYYLQAGRIMGNHSNACLGREWRNMITGKQIAYNYVVTSVGSSDWQKYAQIIKPPAEANACYLWMLNFETEGKAYFDDIVFVEISKPTDLILFLMLDN